MRGGGGPKRVPAHHLHHPARQGQNLDFQAADLKARAALHQEGAGHVHLTLRGALWELRGGGLSFLCQALVYEVWKKTSVTKAIVLDDTENQTQTGFLCLPPQAPCSSRISLCLVRCRGHSCPGHFCRGDHGEVCDTRVHTDQNLTFSTNCTRARKHGHPRCPQGPSLRGPVRNTHSHPAARTLTPFFERNLAEFFPKQ